MFGRNSTARAPLALVVALVTLACRGPASPTSPSSHGNTARAEGPKPGVEQPDPKPPDPKPPPPGLSLSARSAPGEIALSLQNRGLEPIALAASVRWERSSATGFEAVAGAGPSLRMNCAAPPDPCLTLWPGAELFPPVWRTGRVNGQCDCPSCAALPAGTYRAVIRGCKPGFELASEPFRVP